LREKIVNGAKIFMPKNLRPPLTVVDPTAASQLTPPRSLGQYGRALWDRIQSEHAVTDSGGVEMLAQACQALDRAEALADQIASDGEVIRGRKGVREHPALKAELAARSFVVRTLQRLGLNYEPVRAKAGRPTFWASQE
jgi:hypothetical protein